MVKNWQQLKLPSFTELHTLDLSLMDRTRASYYGNMCMLLKRFIKMPWFIPAMCGGDIFVIILQWLRAQTKTKDVNNILDIIQLYP